MIMVSSLVRFLFSHRVGAAFPPEPGRPVAHFPRAPSPFLNGVVGRGFLSRIADLGYAGSTTTAAPILGFFEGWTLRIWAGKEPLDRGSRQSPTLELSTGYGESGFAADGRQPER